MAASAILSRVGDPDQDPTGPPKPGLNLNLVLATCRPVRGLRRCISRTHVWLVAMVGCLGVRSSDTTFSPVKFLPHALERSPHGIWSF